MHFGLARAVICGFLIGNGLVRGLAYARASDGPGDAWNVDAILAQQSMSVFCTPSLGWLSLNHA